MQLKTDLWEVNHHYGGNNKVVKDGDSLPKKLLREKEGIIQILQCFNLNENYKNENTELRVKF